MSTNPTRYTGEFADITTNSKTFSSVSVLYSPIAPGVGAHKKGKFELILGGGGEWNHADCSLILSYKTPNQRTHTLSTSTKTEKLVASYKLPDELPGSPFLVKCVYDNKGVDDERSMKMLLTSKDNSNPAVAAKSVKYDVYKPLGKKMKIEASGSSTDVGEGLRLEFQAVEPINSSRLFLQGEVDFFSSNSQAECDATINGDATKVTATVTKDDVILKFDKDIVFDDKVKVVCPTIASTKHIIGAPALVYVTTVDDDGNYVSFTAAPIKMENSAFSVNTAAIVCLVTISTLLSLIF